MIGAGNAAPLQLLAGVGMRAKNKMQLSWKCGRISHGALWQEDLVSLSSESLVCGTINFSFDSAVAEKLLILHSLSFLIQAIDVSHLDLLPVRFGLVRGSSWTLETVSDPVAECSAVG